MVVRAVWLLVSGVLLILLSSQGCGDRTIDPEQAMVGRWTVIASDADSPEAIFPDEISIRQNKVLSMDLNGSSSMTRFEVVSKSGNAITLKLLDGLGGEKVELEFSKVDFANYESPSMKLKLQRKK